jgi:4-amino-4-deoxy-L-arabinose transferase-like glycosyltransferase
MKRQSFMMLVGLMMLGTALRLCSPGRIGLWRDEVQALNIASLPTLADVTRFLYFHESHPPLFYYLEHLIGWLTGDPASGMAALVLLASIVLIPAVWWLASRSQVRGAGAVAAALVAMSVPLAFFGVQLRPYALLSLAMVVSAAAMLQDRENPSRRWRLLWALTALVLIYLHHAGAVFVIGQVAAALLLTVTRPGWSVQVRAWWPYILAVAVGSLPDLVLLAHQSVASAYPAPHPVEVLRPARDLWALLISFPGELGLGALGALICVVPALRASGPGLAEAAARECGRYVALLFVTTLALFTLASFRSNLLVAYLVLAVAPLGLAASGIAIASAFASRQRWRAAFLAETAIVCVALSTVAFVGNVKTDNDLVARYMMAEAQQDDLVILVPGALGPSFNRVFAGAQSQIDYPLVGRVARYEFDGNFARVASREALQVVLDSVRATCRQGRRLWFVTPLNWSIAGMPPIELSRAQFGGLGQADVARANLLERYANRAFGQPVRVVHPDLGAGAVEALEARLYGPAEGEAVRCEFN